MFLAEIFLLIPFFGDNMIYVVFRHPGQLTAGTQGERCQLVCTLTAGCLVRMS